jgi:type II secretory pathway component PulF
MALIYPVALLAAASSALLFGLLWIVPSVKHIFQDFGIELPAITIVLISLSNFVIDYGLFFCGVLIISACAIPLVLHTLGGRPLRARFKAGTPFFGTMFRCSGLSAFCELLAMFVTAHVALPEGVRMAAEGTGDADLELQFEPVAECLAQGQSDTELARRLANISPHLIHVFHWKTRQTNFVDALNAAAGVYENQAELQITLVSLLLEPVVIIGVLGGAALFVLALFYPLFALLRSLS